MANIAESIKLLGILSSGRKYKAKELGERLGLKESSIRYYIGILREAEFQIEAQRGAFGGYYLDKKSTTNIILKIIDETL